MSVLTVDSESPFFVTQNGYFALWGGTACSLAGVGVSLSKLQSFATSNSSVVLIMIGIAVVILVCERGIVTPT